MSFCRRRIKLRNWVWLAKLERCDLHILREDNTPIIWIHVDSSYQFETRHVSHTQRIKQENSNQKSYADSNSDVLRLVRRWSRLSRDGVIDVDESCNGCCDRNHVCGIANRKVARIPTRSCRKRRYVGITQTSPGDGRIRRRTGSINRIIVVCLNVSGDSNGVSYCKGYPTPLLTIPKYSSRNLIGSKFEELDSVHRSIGQRRCRKYRDNNQGHRQHHPTSWKEVRAGLVPWQTTPTMQLLPKELSSS